MDLKFLLMFINASKVGGWTRAIVAAGFVWLIHKYPVLGNYVTPDAQTDIALALSIIVVGLWSQIAKAIEAGKFTGDSVMKTTAKIIVLAIALSALCVVSARAADAQVPPPLPAPAPAQIPAPATPFLGTACTTTQCTGPYAGAWMAGNGTNADIVGSGLDGSVLAGGAVLGGDIGWQYWNGTMFFGVEAGIGDQVNIGSSLNGIGANETGYFGYQEMQVGGTLAGLFGTSSAPITPPSALSADLITLYGALGIAERPFATGWQTGAGAKFALTPNIFLDIGYRYINYGAATQGALNFNAENLVRLAVQYHF